MKNTLTDLNNYLFEAIERLTDEDMDTDQMEIEMQRAAAITKVSETIIRNGELALKVAQTQNEYGYNLERNHKDKTLAQIPAFIGGDNG